MDLLPGSVVLGEEAAAQRPELYQRLGEPADLWLVDPLDGTANFVEGKRCFSVMVALLRKGQTVASWMLDPLTGHIAIAELGSGAWWRGERIHATQEVPATHALRGAVLTRFLPPALRADIEGRSSRIGATLPGMRCAGHEYPASPPVNNTLPCSGALNRGTMRRVRCLSPRRADVSPGWTDRRIHRSIRARVCWWRRTSRPGVTFKPRCCCREYLPI